MITTNILDESIGIITLDRGSKRNALTEEMLIQLHDGVNRCVAADVRVIQVVSNSAHFCAGADLGEWARPSAQEATRMSRTGIDAFNALAQAPMPTVAALSGVVAGGGLELALACDLRVGTSNLLLGLPELGLANLPSWGGISRLKALIGTSRAQQLLFTGELVDGESSYRLGILNWLVTNEDLETELSQIVQKIVRVDHSSAAFAKALITERDIEPLLAAVTSQSQESRDRKAAFFDRRKYA